ncbi:hypothetical protein Q8A73_018900 [Channa argus]|nr:hypothetical protein Q8A73_018890 [Channa argus]KAK2877381.1 hypothetical protein Q8A73_018900 [Channa argus]
MAFANQGRTIPRVGLRRTLRFQWRSSDREVMPRDLFCTRIIKGQLNLTVEDVFCIQWHQQATGYDVSFVSAETHQAVTARFLDRLSTVPGSAAPRCSRFCCTQMLKVLKGFSTPLHSPAEAIRADASVRVTLVPGGGDLRVKLSQYADDTTLLLDSDECVVRALEVLRIFEGSQELGSTLANVHACAQGGHALHSVFPLPVAIRRPLARTIFNFLWGGRYEWVALGRMMSGLAEGGRDVPDLPLKLDTVFVASLLQDMASEVGHPASLGPRSEQLPWHYAWVANWLRAHPKALEDGIWKQQRVLYRVVRGKVNPSPLLGVPSSVTVGVQAVGQTNGLKDLNRACLHRTLPVRDKIHRHGLGRSPLCPRPSCGAGETAYHVMWECSFTRQLWAKAKKVVGRAKPDLTLTWQVVKRGFVGAHIRSGWGILWLLLSLYKRGLWLARQELVRNEVEWSGLQRGWLRGSNGRYWQFHFRGAGMRMGTQCQVMCWEYNGPVNSLGGTAQDLEVPVEEQRQGSDAKGFVLHQNHQGPVESDGGGRFLYSVASAGNRVSGLVVDSSRFCCTQMFPVLLHPDAEEAIRADASVRVTLVPGGGDLRVKLSQYTDDTTLLLDSDECVVRALEVLRILEGSQELGSTLANVQ